eukprot:s4848_g2.t1
MGAEMSRMRARWVYWYFLFGRLRSSDFVNWLQQWDTWRSARSNAALLDTKLAFEDAFVRTYYVCFGYCLQLRIPCFGRNSVTTTELSGAEREDFCYRNRLLLAATDSFAFRQWAEELKRAVAGDLKSCRFQTFAKKIPEVGDFVAKNLLVKDLCAGPRLYPLKHQLQGEILCSTNTNQILQHHSIEAVSELCMKLMPKEFVVRKRGESRWHPVELPLHKFCSPRRVQLNLCKLAQAELIKQPNIDGFLVGGASLKPSFMDIVSAVGPSKMVEVWPAYASKMEKEGCNQAAIDAFKYNFGVLASGLSTLPAAGGIQYFATLELLNHFCGLSKPQLCLAKISIFDGACPLCLIDHRI